jgi:hypothetical protein
MVPLVSGKLVPRVSLPCERLQEAAACLSEVIGAVLRPDA